MPIHDLKQDVPDGTERKPAERDWVERENNYKARQGALNALHLSAFNGALLAQNY